MHGKITMSFTKAGRVTLDALIILGLLIGAFILALMLYPQLGLWLEKFGTK